MKKGLIYGVYVYFTLFIVIGSAALFFVYGYNYNKDNADECARFFDDFKVRQDPQLYNWKETNSCCHYVMVNQQIKEECKPYG